MQQVLIRSDTIPISNGWYTDVSEEKLAPLSTWSKHHVYVIKGKDFKGYFHMTEPFTLAASAIASMAFTKFLESSAGEAAKKLTPAVLDKIDALRKKIWAKLRGIAEVDELNTTAEQNGKVTEQQIKLLTPHLESAMRDDMAFDKEIRSLAQQIQQDINISQGSDGEIWNVIGHAEKNEFTDNKAPIIKDNTGTVNINYGQTST